MTTSAPHLYVDCDLPAGMSLVEWRRLHHAGRRRPAGLRRMLHLGTRP